MTSSFVAADERLGRQALSLIDIGLARFGKSGNK
jgi:hypothetical protein